MKSELVENLIIAHCSGDEGQFADALAALANDEEKKGNTPTASRLRRAYETKEKSKGDTRDMSASMSFFGKSESTPSSAPRDKDSLLELFEIIKPDVSLEDVVLPNNQKAVIKNVIKEQKEAVNLLKHNVAPINRVLLCGPPGCGKTMTAYAIAHELNLPVAYVRLDGLVSSYLGQTSTNLRRVFDAVRDKRVVLFLDEFDAIAKKRDDSNELGELKRVVTTLLQNFDNMPSNVLLIAATNHDHLLDPAIWRRFNITVTLELPEVEQRECIIKHNLGRYEIDTKIDTKSLAKVTEGASGSQLEELIRGAAKKYIMDGTLKTADITNSYIQLLTKFSDDGEDVMRIISEMLDRGVSLRTAAKALGMTHSTLEYRIQKYRGEK